MSNNLIGATLATFTVTLSAAVTEPVDVAWSTRDGTAKAGTDYEAANGVVTFLPGETAKQVNVTVYGQEDLTALDKNFFIELSPPSNAVLGVTFIEVVITIDEEDGVAVMSLVVPQGKRGLKGDPGLSAYEHAVLMGYEGTVEQWMQEEASASAAATRAEGFASAAAGSAEISTQKATEATAAVASTKQYVDGALSDLSTEANKFYPTKTEAEADIANIAVNQPVTIGDAVNGGLWYKATAGATSLTKSPHDPLKQAKNYTDEKALSGLHKVSGLFFANPYYEKSGENLYVKLGSHNNDLTAGSFFIRAADIADNKINESDAITQLQAYFGSDKYPIISPKGVDGCFKLGPTDCIMYDPDTNTLFGIARSSLNRDRKTYIVVANNYKSIGPCLERDVILSSINGVKISDVAAAAKAASDKVVEGVNNSVGMWFNGAYFERSGNGNIYFKFSPYTPNDPSSGGFYIRNANIPAKTISYGDAMSQLQEHFDTSKYPKTSPLGVADCFELSGSQDTIYYDHVDGRLRAADSSTISGRDRTILIKRDLLNVAPSALSSVILSQLQERNTENLISYRDTFNLALVSMGTSTTHLSAVAGSLATIARGRAIYLTDSKKLYLPGGVTLFNPKTGNTFTVTAAQEIDCSEALSGTSLARIFYDASTATFIARAYSEPVSGLERKTFMTFAVIRHHAFRISLLSTFDYCIDAGINGVETVQDRIGVHVGHKTNEAISYINYDSAAHTLTFPADCIIKYRKDNYALPEAVTLDLAGRGTTALTIYWNVVTRTFEIKNWNTALTELERYRFVYVCSVRDSGIYGNAENVDRVHLDGAFEYYIDHKRFGLASNGITQNHLNDMIKAINHRGYNTAPENTLPAYILSKKMGFSYVECDISFTKDGVPVLLHDDTINRTSNGTGAIKDLNFDEVRMLDFGSWKNAQYAGTQIPSFVEFMRLCHRLSLHPYIEIKTSTTLNSALAQQLIDIVKQTGMQGKVSWISFSASQLNQIKLIDPKARLGLVGTASTNMFNSAINLRTGENEVFVDCATGANTTYELVQQAISLGLDYEVWTENNAANIVTLVGYGVSGISTDYVNVRDVLNNI